MNELVNAGRLRELSWGCATWRTLATADNRENGSFRPGRWVDDIREVVGAPVLSRRVSLGWPEIQPDGPGSWDAAALSRCDRALDELLERGFKPCVNLSHMDLPAWLDDQQGWLVRDSVFRFADYAAEIGRRFGDRVERWVTINDIAAPTLADRVAGMFDVTRGRGRSGLVTVHHALLAHALAREALRAAGAHGPAGLTTSLVVGYPATDDPWDRLAAERLELWGNGIFLDPLLLGRHMVSDEGECPVEQTGCVRPGDLEAIAARQDFVGLSWHAPHCVTATENLPGMAEKLEPFHALAELNRLLARLDFAMVPFPDVESTSYGWSIVPEALADGLAALDGMYGDLLPPLYITDHGLQDQEILGPDGAPDAARRRSLLAAKLSWLARSMESGMDIKGYEYWSVFDNLDFKQRYSRLYSVADGGGGVHPRPEVPESWPRRFEAVGRRCPKGFALDVSPAVSDRLPA
ncbi:family 1 glycosylhydrolase [Kitasatospora sp. NPDC101235]|uniref:family 1 glycosylhydrolase n=1 Tax=Kitasatospora sp. NPDC101235 TaxID=3364101 RepID=UPI003821E23F